MPLYEYHCDNCVRTFDEFRPMDHRHTAVCPMCNGTARKLPSVPRLDYYNMGVQDGLPTAIEKWARMHREEAKREYD